MKNFTFMMLLVAAGPVCFGVNFFATAQTSPAKEKTMFTLRVARPTDNLPEVIKFYRDGLELEVLASFSGHNDFDGVILGRKGFPYHLEFTHQAGHKVGKAPTQDNLLVFYIPDHAEWTSRPGKSGIRAPPGHPFPPDAVCRGKG